jgi:hypothetical protein
MKIKGTKTAKLHHQRTLEYSTNYQIGDILNTAFTGSGSLKVPICSHNLAKIGSKMIKKSANTASSTYTQMLQ